MQSRFGAVILVSMMLASIFGISFAISPLVKSITIANQGRIGFLKAPITYKSEIRGVFIHEAIYSYPHNWTIIAQTLASYGIDSVYVNDFDIFHRRPDSEITAAINAFHAVGIEYHACMNGIAESKNNETAAVNYTGGKPNVYAQCPIKVKPYVEAAIRNYIGNHSDVDGIMIDYMRTGISYCYCDEHKAAFDQWYYVNYGEHVSNWTEFYPDQPKWNIYANWRNEPVNELVKIIHDTAKSLKPDIVISEAAWSYFSDCPIYWRKFIGQDTGRWIKEGWIDMVAPMMYVEKIYGKTGETLESCIDACQKYMTGGVEGKIPLLAFTGLCTKNATNFAAHIDYIRARGLDGWIFWRYGGPGVDSGGALEDITPYLEAVTMPETFKLGNVEVSASETEAAITWTTTLPATSRIEYNTLPLFNATWETWGNFPYWRINKIQGSVLENSTLTRDHSITLTGLFPETQYYFRVQSQESSGTATSKVYTFTTSGGPTLFDFSLSNSGNITVTQSQSGSNTITATLVSGSTQTVTLSTSSLPSEATASFSPDNICNPTCSRTLTISTTSTTPTGSFTITVSGTGGGLTRSTQFILTVNPTPTLTVSGKLIDKNNNPLTATISLFQQGTNNIVNSTQTSNGNYSLSLSLGTYDLQYTPLNFFITNFFVKLLSLNISSNLSNPVNYITNISNQNVSFTVNITDSQLIQTYSPQKPERVLIAGTPMTEVSSYSQLTNNTWYYNSTNNRLYILATVAPPPR